MILANLRHLARTGTKPAARHWSSRSSPTRRPAACYGSHWLVDHHPELFEGVDRGDQRGRRLQRHRARRRDRRAARLPAADRREGHRLAAAARPRPGRPRLGAQRRQRRRPAGRGDRPDRRPRLAARVHRLGPRSCSTALSDAHRRRVRRRRPRRRCSRTSAARQGFVRGTLQDTANVTMLDARLQAQRHPADAPTAVAGLPLPARPRGRPAWPPIRELAGEHVEVEVVHRDVALEAPFAGDLVESMNAGAAAPRTPSAAVLPYCLSGGTDNKALEPARHHRLRLRAAAAARRPRLRADVPRHRRAGAGGLAAVRGAGAAAASCATC